MPTFITSHSRTTQRRWYVVQCKPRQDCRALEHLARQGFHCCIPALHVEKLQHGRVIEVEEPLFPEGWQTIASRFSTCDPGSVL
jgi:hypothetical protein